MLFTSTISGPDYGYGYSDYGFGAAALVQGTGFNCNSSICYAIGPANHALFQQLQQTLNQYAKLGLSAYTGQLTVDGFIGAATVSAARAAAAAALLPSPGSTKEQVAANAPTLQAGLQAFLAGTTGTKPMVVATSQPTSTPQPIPSSVVTPTSTNVRPVPTSTPSMMTPQQAATALPAQVAVQPSPSSAAAAAASLAPAKGVPLWVWITAGAVGVVVIGGIGYAVLHKPEAKPAMKPAAAKAALARRRRRR
jgi:lysozyme family protein